MSAAKRAFQAWQDEQPEDETEERPMPILTTEIEQYSHAPHPEYWKWILFQDGAQIDCGLARSEALAKAAADHARHGWEDGEESLEPTDIVTEQEIEAVYEIPELGGEGGN